MLLNCLLELGEDESVLLPEESLQDLMDLPVTSQILSDGLDSDKCIEIKNFGLALHLNDPMEFWLLLTDKYSQNKVLKALTHEWRSKGCRAVVLTDSDFFSALVEYYAVSLANVLFCESCSVVGEPAYVKARIDRLEALLMPLVPPNGDILEICCGSGMATQALLRLGQSPLSMDKDRCDLCQALKSGLMDPKRCLVLDATLLPQFFLPQSFHTVLGFMVGLINDFNWPMWRDILLKASSLARDQILFTVYSKKEAELIAKALGEAGWNGGVIDNRDPLGIYDQWAYLARREK